MEVHAGAPSLLAPPQRLPRHAFTLPEVLWGAGILLAVAILGLPSVRFVREAAEIAAARDDVAATILQARWLALTSGDLHTVDFSGSEHSIVLRSDTTPAQTLDLADRSVTQDATAPILRFDRHGLLADRTLVTITLRNRHGMRRSVTVSALGKVTRG